jgi:hypothetical protein
MRRFSEKANARIIFRQGSINASYLLHLYNLYQEFVTTPPAVQSITDKNKQTTKSNKQKQTTKGQLEHYKIRENLSFATLALPCFNELYEAFYLEGHKINPNNIAALLS